MADRKLIFGVMDCNNFFVSCERVFNPALEGKAVVVLSNNDGCSISRSQEAKDLGIKMGTTAFNVQREFVEKGHPVEMCSSNYVLYADMSRRVMSVLQSIVPDIEIYSIDEAFINFSGMSKKQIDDKSREIVYKVRKFIGIPVCVGVGYSMTLAKAANRFAKHFKGYKGYCYIDTEDKREKALRLLDVGDVWGIGRRLSKFLKSHGVNTAYDFTKHSAYWVKKNMGVTGLRTYDELNGRADLMIEEDAARQSITTSRSFGEMVEDKEQLGVAISNFAASCAEKLRAQHSAAESVTVYITTNFFRNDLPQYYNTATIEFPEATNSTVDIVRECKRGLDAIYRDGFKYKKGGVVLGGIIPEDQVQQNLFVESNYDKMKNINNLLDSVNHKFGRNKLHLAVQGSTAASNVSKEKWQMRREHLSKNYTTNLNEIITLKA
jgi:DNA polymerase V